MQRNGPKYDKKYNEKKRQKKFFLSLFDVYKKLSACFFSQNKYGVLNSTHKNTTSK
jgi:hypothetical protein